jgi:hypothetical protein
MMEKVCALLLLSITKKGGIFDLLLLLMTQISRYWVLQFQYYLLGSSGILEISLKAQLLTQNLKRHSLFLEL